MADRIKFILNGKETEVDNLSPVTTLLQYLRLHARLPGTKEGCAEGDCGACTVAVGQFKSGKVDYQSVNACIAFLPTMDGREVVTVEHLKSKTGELNPVQDAMVKCHGSQCGFCTPGFVMALSTLMNNNKNANDEDIQDAIAGNLCRCTGYRPILDAARMANESRDRTLPSNPDALKKIQRDKMLSYEGADGKFFAPVTVEELADICAQYPDATIPAGGTDVGLWVTKFHMELPVIIYTGNVTELRQIRETPEGLESGGAASYTDAFAALAAYGPTMEAVDYPGNGTDENALAGDLSAIHPQVRTFGMPDFRANNGMNVVLVVVETFRVDVIGKRIDGREVTPFLNEMARTQAYTDQAYSNYGVTARAIQSLFKGSLHYTKEDPSIADELRRVGYRT